jgi:hypothetical protein
LKSLNGQINTRSLRLVDPVKFTLRLEQSLYSQLSEKSIEHNITTSELIRLLIQSAKLPTKQVLSKLMHYQGSELISESIAALWRRDELTKLIYTAENYNGVLSFADRLTFAQALAKQGDMAIAQSVIADIAPASQQQMTLLNLAKVKFLLHDKLVNQAETLLRSIVDNKPSLDASTKFIYSQIHMLWGEVYFYREKFAESLDNLFIAQNYLDTLNYPNILGHIYMRILLSANRLQKFEISELAYKRVLQIATESNNCHLVDAANSEVVNLPFSANLAKADVMVALKNSLVQQKRLGNKRGVFYGYAQIAKQYIHAGEAGQAYSFFKQARDLELSYRPNNPLSFSEVNMAFIEAKHNYQKSLDFIQQKLLTNKGNLDSKLIYYHAATSYIHGPNRTEVAKGRSLLLKLGLQKRGTFIEAAASYTLANRLVSKYT